MDDCQVALGLFALFVVVIIFMTIFNRNECSGQSKRETLDSTTIRKYINDPSVGYVGPINSTRNTGFYVLGNPFVNPAPLYSDYTDPLNSLLPPFNPIASGY